MKNLIKKKNQGFTLIELVIAVVILAIAVSPLVSNFIQSGKMNLKGRKALNAMNLAQDIMEGMSQYSVSQNTTFFDKASVSANALVDKRILPGDTTLTDCALDAAASDDDHRVYNITGIKTTNGPHNTYDIKVTFDSLGEVTNPGTGDHELDEINAQQTAEIQGLDTMRDVVFTYDSSMRSADLAALANKTTDPGSQDISRFSGKVSRLFTINITKDPANNNYAVKVVRKYTGDASLGFTVATENSSETQSSATVPDITKMPRAIYFYYQGFPGATRPGVGVASQEKIKVVNKTGEPVTVYLIRTISQTDENDPLFTTYNHNYACDLDVEGFKADGITPDDNVDIVYNLRYNLSQEKNARKYEEQSSVTLPNVTDEEVGGYLAERSNLTYNGATVSEDVYKLHFNDGYRTSSRKLLYKVKIEISEPGKNVLATYTGGLSN